MMFRRKRFRLVVDGLTTLFRSPDEALAAAQALSGSEYGRWSISKLESYGWSRPIAFGWSASTSDANLLADLSRMGVPIDPGCISDGLS